MKGKVKAAAVAVAVVYVASHAHGPGHGAAPACGAPCPYRNPLRGAGVTPGRIDQGVDFTGLGPVYALGAGRVVSVRNSGWPGGAFVAYRLSGGPDAGWYVYAAEDINPSVRVGQKVGPSTRLGTIAGSIETGWAAPPPHVGESLARLSGQWNSSQPATADGISFRNLLESLGGVR